MKNYILKHRTAFGLIGMATALCVAAVYFFVVPEEAARATPLQAMVLRYGHSLCWILLGAASLLWAIKQPKRRTAAFLYAALTTYLFFLGTVMAVT